MNEKFEEFDVNFKIVSNKNENVYAEGYVTINDEDGEDVDWYFWNGNGYQSSPFFQHDEETIKGLTIEQNRDIDTFKEDYSDDALWIDTCIIQSDECENRTYVRENCTLIINEGAEFEVDYEDYDSSEWDADYYMAFTLKWNGDIVSLDEDGFWENPYTYEEFKVKDIPRENRAYIVEVPKTIWEDPQEVEMNEKIMEEMCDSFLWAYKKSLVRELGIFGIAYRISKSLEDGEVSESDLQNSANIIEQEFEDMEIEELAFMSSDDVEKFIEDEYEENRVL